MEKPHRFVYENKDTPSPKVYVLQPWIVNLLVNYEQQDCTEDLLAGQVLRILSDPTAPDQPGVLQDAVLHVSDGSYYIRVVIASEALRAEENAHMQFRLSSLICRIIVLQNYTVCFREEPKLEDCEFYLTAQRFIVLPMERQRLDSPNGNQEPSVLEKIKELWLRSLALKNAPSSEPSISQLIDAIAENQLDILKENAEQCLDLGMPQDTPVAVKDKVPVTPWEAERKKERGEDIFMVPAHALVTTPVEEVVTCEASKADTSEAAPGKSEEDRTTLGHMRVTSQVSRESCLVRITCSHIAFYPDAGSTHLLLGLRRGAAESSALSETSEGSLDNPWNQLPPISLTLNSSDEKTCQDDLSQQTKEDVAADSNTPDLLEPCSQDSAEGLPQGEPLQTSSPSLLLPHSNTSPVETSTTQVEPSSRAPSPAEGLQVSGAPQAPLPSFSPVFPVLPSSRAPALPGGMPQREQADSSGTAFPPDPLKHGPAPARTQGGDAVGAKRKLVGGDEVLTTLPEEQRPQGAPERDAGRRPELLSTWGAKKSRREETGLQCGEELEEEEQPSPASGPSSRPEQRRALPPYVKEKPSQYRYKAPSPELCRQIRSIRISKAMLKWACWILTDREVDS